MIGDGSGPVSCPMVPWRLWRCKAKSAQRAQLKKRLVVLISKGVSDRAQKTNQQRALSILAARKTPYEEVDGMDPTQKERRDSLWREQN